MTSRGDVAYQVYIAVLLLAALAGPGLHALIVSLSDSELVTLLRHDNMPAVVAVATGLLLCLALAAGALRGPVLMRPFTVHLVAGGPKRRRVSLRRPFLTTLVLLVMVGVVLGAVPGATLLRVGLAGPSALVGGAVAGGSIAVLVCVAWLAGQVLSRRAVAWAALVCLVLTGMAALAALGARPGGPGLGGWALLTALVACLLAIVPQLLDRLRGPVLLEQARRWQSATTAGGVGDLAAAVATYRTRPQRPWPANAVGSTARLPVLFLRRDLVGAVRTPVRSLVGIAALSIALLLGVWALAAPGTLTWLLVAGAWMLTYLALGVWSDGFRHAAEASVAPTLYGVSDTQLLGLHALLPLLVVLITGVAVGLLVLLLAGQPLMAVLAASGALFCVAVRMFDAAKGPLPLVLLTPMPTPMGDASSISVALWQADALLIAAFVPTIISAAVLSSGALLLLAYLPALAGVLLGLRHRLKEPRTSADA